MAIAALVVAFLFISWVVVVFFNNPESANALEQKRSPVLISFSTLILQVIMLCLAIYFGPLKTNSPLKSLGFKSIDWPTTLRWTFVALFLSLVTSVIYVSIAGSLAPDLLPPDLKQQLGLQDDSPLILLVLIFVVLALGAPFSEEVFNRGFALQGIEFSLGKWPALILSAGFFAAAHMSLGLLVPAFVSGIIFGAIYIHVRSIWPVFFAHMCQNSLAFTALMLT